MTASSTIPGFMLVTNRLRSIGPIAGVVRAAMDGGIQAVQVRENDLPATQLIELARQIREVVPAEAPLLINGSAAIAGELGIGLHLPESMSLTNIDRTKMAAGTLIGRSVHSPGSARRSRGVDYVIAGHVYDTASKQGIPVLGLAGLAAIVMAAPCPVLAIGGVTPDRVHDVLATGAHGIAVMSGICASDDPFRKAGEFVDALNGARMIETTETSAETLEVQVNGKAVELRSGTTVSGFLEQKELHQNMVVVEHNGQILKKGQFADIEIRAGDVIEVVHFVGGG